MNPPARSATEAVGNEPCHGCNSCKLGSWLGVTWMRYDPGTDTWSISDVPNGILRVTGPPITGTVTIAVDLAKKIQNPV